MYATTGLNVLECALSTSESLYYRQFQYKKMTIRRIRTLLALDIYLGWFVFIERG